jgi:phage tail-like protein
VAATADRDDPFVAFRFSVQLDGLARAGFSECTGLQIEMEMHEYQEGGVNDHVLKFPTRARQGNLTLRRGIADRELWDWFFDLTRGRVAPKDGSILVQDPSGAVTRMQWDFTAALPVKWQGADLNAAQNNVAVETLELSYLLLERVI